MPEIAIVTGASRGIGAAIALQLARDQHHVIALARTAADLASVAATIRAGGGMCTPICCDVSNLKSIETAIATARAEAGTPNILVNNAGLGGPFHHTTDVSDDEWDLVFNTNVKSAFRLSRLLLPGMQRSGFGRIINIASVHALFGAATSSTYAASKHALLGYTKSLAAEWGSAGITVNAICPGYIDTAMIAGDHVAHVSRDAVTERIPARRLGVAHEVAALAAFLARRESAYINGATITIDGGLTAELRIP